MGSSGQDVNAEFCIIIYRCFQTKSLIQIMLEFTLLVLPTEINASGTVKSVKSASICLDCISLCNKILSKLGNAVVVEGHHPGTDFA